jgi:uncharacterized membrane protein YdbT with pleckstrin-like domain
MKILKPHPFAYLFYYLGGVTIFLLLLNFGKLLYGVVAGAVIVALTEIVRRAEKFYVGENEVGRIFKLITSDKVSARYGKIQDIEVEQSIFDRIFNIGKIKINTAGSPAPEIIFRGVKNPYGIESAIRKRLKANNNQQP